MAPPSLLLLLSLALSAQSWPQHHFDSEDAGMAMTLPVIPYSHRRTRSLPKLDDWERPGTLPVPGLVPRKLPSESETSGTWTLPIVHFAKPGLMKRDSTVEVQLENRSDVAYYAQLNIGTPPQTVYAQLDTGSFELWVNPDCTQLSPADQTFCQAVGVYTPGDSSTSEVTDETATLRYGIGAAAITYVHDDISLAGSSTMKNVQFGIATQSKDQFAGILGIGHGKGINTNYNNFLDELSAQGVIKTKMFSLALGSKAEEEGVIVFGGVDRAKFEGKLATLPIIPAEDSPDGVARYWVQMKSLSQTDPDGETTAWANTAMPVFLDSGATLTLLPPDLVQGIANSLGAQAMDGSGFYAVDCSLADQDGSINFAFEGVTINVPYKEIIRQVKSPNMCYLGMMPSDSFALLGDTFLRSAYVAFDLETNTTYMAPYNNCGSKPKTINTSSDIENLKGTCGDDKGTKPAPSAPSSTPIPIGTHKGPDPKPASGSGSDDKSGPDSGANAGSQNGPDSSSPSKPAAPSVSPSPTRKLVTTTVARPTVSPTGASKGIADAEKGGSNSENNKDDKDNAARSNGLDVVGVLAGVVGFIACLAVGGTL